MSRHKIILNIVCIDQRHKKSLEIISTNYIIIIDRDRRAEDKFEFKSNRLTNRGSENRPEAWLAQKADIQTDKQHE